MASRASARHGPTLNGTRGNVRNTPEILAAYQADKIECPSCGSKRLDDNGARTLSTMSFCCGECGEQFDADAIVER